MVHSLDTKYDKANLQSVVSTNCTHLSLQDQNKVLDDETQGDWNIEPVSFELKEGAKPHHGTPFPVPRVHKYTIIKELNRLHDLEVLEFQPASEWVAPSFTIPKIDKLYNL